jgi:hypothetical protein
MKQLLSETELDEGKSLLEEIVALLVGLIRSHSLDRPQEETVECRGGEE